jgi:hypothetical protein
MDTILVIFLSIDLVIGMSEVSSFGEIGKILIKNK